MVRALKNILPQIKAKEEKGLGCGEQPDFCIKVIYSSSLRAAGKLEGFRAALR